MLAALENRAAVVNLLLRRGADGAKTTTQAAHGIAAGSTALELARTFADDDADFAETLAALQRRGGSCACRIC